jgi:hypothetical protein
MRKFLTIFLVITFISVTINAHVIAKPTFPKQMSDLEPKYTLTPPVVATTYNSISRYDPFTDHLALFSATSLIKQTDPRLSWLPALPDFEINLSENRPTPGIYTVSWGKSPQNVAIAVIGSKPTEQKSKVLVLVPDYTWSAYNRTGGGSFYSGKPYPAHSAESLDRPLNAIHEVPVHDPAKNPIKLLSKWAGGAVDVAAQSDVVHLKYSISKYSVIVLYGHDEYWTPELRLTIENAVLKGSNLLNLSGNTGYRDISVHNRAISVVESGSENEINRLGWRMLNLARVVYAGKPTSNFLIGQSNVSMRKILKAANKRGFPESKELSLHPKNAILKFQRLLVLTKNDSLFAGVSKDKNGFVTGGTAALVQGEIDGVPMTEKWKIIQPFPRYIKSGNVQVVAGSWQGPKIKPVGIVIRSTFGRGKVITIGSISWVSAMVAMDISALQITKNALTELLGK